MIKHARTHNVTVGIAVMCHGAVSRVRAAEKLLVRNSVISRH